MATLDDILDELEKSKSSTSSSSSSTKKKTEQRYTVSDVKNPSWLRMFADVPNDYGRSYKEKYTNFMRQQGIDDNTIEDFYVWMSKNSADQEDKETKRLLSLMNTTDDNGQNLPITMQNPKNQAEYDQRVNQNNAIIQREGLDPRRDRLQIQANVATNEPSLGDALGQIGKAVNPFDDTKAKDALDNLMGMIREREQRNRQEQGDPTELDRALGQFVNSATLGTTGEAYQKIMGEEMPELQEREGLGNKALDFLYSTLGYLAPGGLAAKGLRSVGLGAKSKSFGQLAKEGAILGGGLSGIEEGIDYAITPDDRTLQQALTNIGLNTAAGVVVDPAVDKLLGVLGRRFTKTNTNENPPKTGSEENQTREMVTDTLPGQEVVRPFDPNAQRLEGQQLALNEPNLALNEPPYRYGAKDVEIEGTPLLNAPTGATKQDLDEILTDYDSVLQRYNEELDNFVKERMQPFDEVLENQAKAEQEWSVYKQLQEEAKRIKKDYGTLYVPKGNQADWLEAIPKRYRAGKGRRDKAYDIYKAAEEEGFTNVDDFVSYLQYLDNAMNIRKTDLQPADNLKISPDEYDQLVAAARQEFSNTDTGKGLDELLARLIQVGGEVEQEIKGADVTGEPLLFKREVIGRADKLKQYQEPYTRKMKPSEQIAVSSQGTRYNVNRVNDDVMRVEPIPNETQTQQPYTFKRTRIVTDGSAPKEGQFTEIPNEPKINASESTTTTQDPTENVLNGVYGARNKTTQARKATPISDTIDYGNVLSKEANNNRKLKEKWYNRIWNQFSKAFNADDVYIKVAENELERKNRFAEPGYFYKYFSNMRGHFGKTIDIFENDFMPILDKVQKNGGSTQEAFDYLTAKHLKEIKEKNPEYKLPKGKTMKELDDTISMFEGNAVYDNFVQDIQNYRKSLLQMALDNEVIDQETFDSLMNEYQFYTPKFRATDLANEDAFEAAFKETITPISGKNPIRSLGEGSELPLQDPLQSWFLSTQKMVQATMKNKALKELDRLAQLDTEGKWVSFDKDKIPGHAENNEITYTILDENGKLRHKTVYVNKELAYALNRSTTGDVDKVIEFAKSLSRTQRMMITGNPTFVIRNAIRDAWQTWTQSPSHYSFLHDYFLAAIDLITDGKWAEQNDAFSKLIQKMAGNEGSLVRDFYRSGAGSSNIWSYDSRAFRDMQEKAYTDKRYKDFSPVEKKTGEKIINLVDKYRENFVDRVENFSKMAEFRSTIRKGGTVDEAAYNARSHADFFRSGSFVRKVNPYIGFLNTTIQGRSRFFTRALEAHNKGAKEALHWWSRNAMAGVVPSALAWWAYNNFATDDQKQLIDEAPQYLRDAYWLLPDEKGTGVYRFPKPFETAAYFSFPMEMILRGLNDAPNNELSDVMDKWVLDNVLFDPTLTIFQPFFEIGLNRDSFTGQEVYNENAKPSEQIGDDTSQTAKYLAKPFQNPVTENIPLVNWMASPQKVDALIEGLFPTTGVRVTDTIDDGLAKLGMGNQTERPMPIDAVSGNGALDFALNPLTQFHYEGEGRNTPLLGNFYDAYGRYQYVKANGGLSEEDQQRYAVMNKARSQINKLSSAINDIEASDKYNAEQKREQLNVLVEARNNLIRELYENGYLTDLP